MDETPEDVSGGSYRVTALNEMDYRGIFPHRMAAVSGHFLTLLSALWEYIITNTLSCLPGVMALAGWSHASINDGLYRKAVVVPSIQSIWTIVIRMKLLIV